ncbi:putative macrolide phosphotransferase k [Macrophomina phaseolina]|uniref:Macrolide phosphotransferase k n=1 Tax=Macrophomina phaseolina TaxID=35725 RepID=A0ABQ8G8B1_9PEZI|nr:putative macrolide phosphotransferase k [Macrophomina phaseolina]
MPQDGAEDILPAERTTGWRFWLVFASLCALQFLSALDATIITIALPTISRSLGSTEYTWIINGYTLPSTSFLVLVGQLSDFFDRKPAVLTCVFLFAGGSAICGAAQNIGMIISGRVIQGIGGGGVAVLAEIVCSDMVALEDRSKYLGLLISISSIGVVLGPIIGGAIVANTTWRWMFYINIPLSSFAFFFLVLVLKPQTPGLEASTLPYTAKLRKIDWIGNATFTISSTLLLYGLVAGGNDHPWSSAAVIVPLVLGAIGLVIFRWWEGKAECPVTPPRLFNNHTAIAMHILACFVILMLSYMSYFLPVYFQAVLQESEERSSVLLLPTVLPTVPSSIIGGLLLSVYKRAREIHLLASGAMAAAFGVFTLFDASTSLALRVIMQILASSGVGMLVATILPGLQAQLPESDIAAVTALFTFMRSLGGVWGVTIPSVVFNARVNHGLGGVSDASLRERLANGGAYSLASASFIKSLVGEVKTEVIDLYVSSLSVVWYVAMALSLAAFLLACTEKRIEIKSPSK